MFNGYMKKVVVLGLLAFVGGMLNVNAAPAKNRVGQLSAKAHSGRIAVRSDRGDLPAGASLTMTRQKDAATLERVQNALNKRKGIKSAKPAPSVLAAYDISIDEGKTAWQPAAGSPVRVTVTLDEPVAAAKSAKLGIVHIADDGTAEALESSRYGFERDPATHAVTGFWVAASGFSIYAITDQAILKYSFYNGSTHVADEYVKSGETLYDPGIGGSGLKYGETFVGWATSSTATTGMTIAELNAQLMGTPGFNSIYASNPEGIKLYAIIKKAYYLRYLTQKDGELVVLYTEIVAADASESARTLAIFDGSSWAGAENQTFTSWLGSDNHIYLKNDTVTLTDHLDLYIKVEGRYWLVFDANAGGPGSGATYTPPQLYVSGASGTTLSKPDDPTWSGYQFLSWNTQADGYGTTWTDATFNSAITDDVTLYAQWDALPVNYYVIYWKQSTAGGDSYDYAGSRSGTADTGAIVSTTTEDTTMGGTSTSEFGYYFTYNSTKSQTQAEVKADGTTVLNVYYDRRTVTMNFLIYGYAYTPTTGNDGTQYGTDDGVTYFEIYRDNRLFVGTGRWYKNRTGLLGFYSYSDEYTGTRYTRDSSWLVYKTFSGPYYATFEECGWTWPSEYWWYEKGNADGSIPQGSGNSRTTFMASFMPTSDSDNISFYGTSVGSGSRTVEFYKQNLDGSYPATTQDSVTAGTGTFKISDKYNGYTADHYNTGGSDTPLSEKDGDGYYASVSDYTTLKVYFRRNGYKMMFLSEEGPNTTGRSEETVSGIRYGASLSDQADHVPTNGKDGYAFLGWYEDEDLLVPFDFATKTMKDSDVTVFAKWGQQRVRVVLDPGCTDYLFANNQALTFRLDYNEKISDANMNRETALRSGYKLEGWYAVEDGEEFAWTFATQVNLAVDGVDMNYQTSQEWATNKYGDNDGRHDNVQGILKLRAKWALELEESAVYIKYDMDPGYKVYDSAGNIQTVIPVDPNHYIWNGGSSSVSFQVADAPSGYTSGFTFSRWVLLDAAGNRTNESVDPGAPLTVASDNVKSQTVTDDLGNTHVLRTITLVAQFTPDETKATMLTYDGQGGLTTAGNTTDSTAMLVNESFTTANGSAFNRPGYTFTGWNTKADGSGTPVASGVEYAADNKAGLAWDSDSEVNILYAQWTANTDTKYKVKYYLQDTDGTYPNSDDVPADYTRTGQGTTDTTVRLADLTDLNLADPTESGYVVDADAANVTQGTIAGDESLELKVYFKRCKVIFDKFEENADDLNVEAAFKDQYVLRSKANEVQNPSTLSSYVKPTWSDTVTNPYGFNKFLGWMIEDAANGTFEYNGKKYRDFEFSEEVEGDEITLYARWKYPVTFVISGDPESPDRKAVTYWRAFGDLVPNPTKAPEPREGNTCTGWGIWTSPNEAPQRADGLGTTLQVPKGGIILTAFWTPTDQLTSAQQFQSVDSTYGMIAGISAGSTGATTLSAKGRTLLAPTAQTRHYTVRHAVYAAYPYYTVLKCDDLANPVWTAAEDSRNVTGVSATSVEIPVDGKRGFFRLLLSTKPLTKGATKLDK